MNTLLEIITPEVHVILASRFAVAGSILFSYDPMIYFTGKTIYECVYTKDCNFERNVEPILYSGLLGAITGIGWFETILHSPVDDF